jgi:uncharacterized Zn finger protein (UPF0148 family)
MAHLLFPTEWDWRSDVGSATMPTLIVHGAEDVLPLAGSHEWATILMIASLHCPNCGAPLNPGPNDGLVICLYCNTAIRIQTAVSQPQVTAEASLDPDMMTQIKQQLLAGRQDQALRLYQQQTGADPQEAASAVSNLGRQISIDIVRGQTLRPFGMVFVVVVALLLVVSVAAGLQGRLHPVLAIGLAGFAALNLFFFAPGIRATIEFLGAKTAPATIVKLAPVGVATMRGRPIHTFKFLLEVQPEDGQAFHAELLVPVRSESLLQAQPGALIWVKYLPQNPARLIFYKSASAG